MEIKCPARTIGVRDTCRFQVGSQDTVGSRVHVADAEDAPPDCAVKWTRLSCHSLRDNRARARLFAPAHDLGDFLPRLALPRSVQHGSLTTLREKLIKIGPRPFGTPCARRFRWPRLPCRVSRAPPSLGVSPWLSALPPPGRLGLSEHLDQILGSRPMGRHCNEAEFDLGFPMGCLCRPAGSTVFV